MKNIFCKVIAVVMLVTILFSTSVAGIVSSAVSEADYVANFSIKTDKTSLSEGDEVVVSVNLKTNYYIYSMEIPVIYDADALELQNTSTTSLKSFLTFKGKLASAYVTNGNWKSPENFYTKRNSNTAFWSQQEIMDKYKIAFASWASDTSLNDGKAVMLSEEETIVSFVLEAKKDINNVSNLIFLSEDFKKTADFAGGRWFCGRSPDEKLDVNNYVSVGQTIEYNGIDPIKCTTVTVTNSDGALVKEELISGDLTEYALESLENGEYTVIFSKFTYVTRSYSVTVTDNNISMSFELCKIGDVTGDGIVNTIDVARANAHAKGVSILTGYNFACSDVNEDGKVNTIDVARINSHAKGVSKLW